MPEHQHLRARCHVLFGVGAALRGIGPSAAKPLIAFLVGAAVFAATPAKAQTPPNGGFAKPIACTPDRDCWIINLPDADAGPKAVDHRCGFRTYNTHKGTDFAVRDYRAMDAGVPVLAADDGIVTSARDGAGEYFLQTKATRQAIGRRACGNRVIIEHSGGWESQYCHMRKGSIAVKLGERVKRGAKLGFIGMSGRTEFPHVHIEFRHNGKPVDPFTGHVVGSGCDRPGKPIWHRSANVQYPGFALYAAGFTDHSPTMNGIASSARSPVAMPRHAPALVLWGAAFGVRRGDVLKLRILDPGGTAIAAREIRLDRAQARRMAYAGRKMPAAGWTVGRWKGEVQLQRFVNGRTVTRSIVVPLTVK